MIEKAKKYAKNKWRSLSDTVGNYLKIISQKSEPEIEKTSVTESLRGSFKAPEDFNYKKELARALSEKH